MIIGIDLGTTNSLVAYFDEKEGVKIIPNRLGEKLTPSVVSIDEDGTVYVGATAKERRITHPDSTVEVFKRDMGTGRVYNIHNNKYTPTEMSSLVLKSLKEDAEAYLGVEITEAVISVPAYFNDMQRKATKKAGELAGIKVERIVNEPTAAAIAYGLDKMENNSKFLVFDLGGGTLDVSLLELDEGIMEVHCVAGDNFLGGEDFTRVIYNMFLNKHELDSSLLSSKTKNHILKQAERCKIALSDKKTLTMKCIINESELEMLITEEMFREACSELMERIKKPVARALRDAKLTIEDVDMVIMVGGSTRMHIVRSYVATLMRKLPDYSINPDEAIVTGACIQAAMKERNKAVEDLILTDVCPYTLGIGICNRNDDSEEKQIFSPIIQRNTTVPVSRTKTYYTIYDYQSQLAVKIFQGENRIVENNLKLGELTVNVPIKPAGTESIDVTFTYDINSLLEVIVKVNSTGEIKRKVIKNPNIDISDEEIEKRFKALDYLKIPPREQEENKLVLFKAEELYEELLGEERNGIAYEIELFEYALNNSEPEKIDEARERLMNIIKMLDN